jgi:uncharacterized protein (TIGR02145 family)
MNVRNTILTFLAIILSSIFVLSYSQSIENVDFRAEGKTIVIKYDLFYKNQDTLINIELTFKNENGQTVTPKSISGDLDLVKPGEQKTIIWNVLSDGINLSGKYAAQLKIRNILVVKLLYDKLEYCQSDVNSYLPILNGSGPFKAGVFSSTPDGLTIDKYTGKINPIASKAGKYSITYNTKNSIEYPSISSKYNMSIIPNPSISGSNLCAVNEIIQLKATDDSRSPNSWSSENQNIATVSSSGLVTGLKQGNVIIKYTNFLGCEQKTSIQITDYPSVKIDMKYDCKCEKQYCFCQTTKSQIWMTKNLDVTSFKNGDKIPQAKNPEEWLEAGKKGKPVWCYYDFNSDNDKMYGKLYNWYALSDIRGLAPNGWHIPRYEEWGQLLDASSFNSSVKPDYYGHCEKNPSSASRSLKAKTLWEGDCIYCKGDNASGFNGLPSGMINVGWDQVEFRGKGNEAYYGVSEYVDDNGASYSFKLSYEYPGYKHEWLKAVDKSDGISVRCIKD